MENDSKKVKSSNEAGGTEGAYRETGVAPAAIESAPDPEVPAKKRRRKLTASYKLKILQKIDDFTEPGQVGALLRREGLYSSNITRWRKQRDQGALQAMTPKKGGRKTIKNPMSDEVARLKRENERLRKKLWQAEQIIDVQKKISEILGIEQNLNGIEGSDS